MYHINPETGNPGVCRAKIKCRFGDLETEHYESRESAQAAFEKAQEKDQVRAALQEAVAAHAHQVELRKAAMEKMAEDREARSKEIDVNNLTLKERYALSKKIVEEDRQDPTSGRYMYEEANRKAHEALKKVDQLRAMLAEPVEPHVVDFPQVIGLETAQEELMIAVNRKPESFQDDEDGVYYVEDVVPHMREMTARYLRGERSGEEDYVNGYSTPGSRLLADLSANPSSTMSSNMVYSALIFPEKDLKPVLERLGVTDVSVSHFLNGRENGLVYTVMQPDGNSRSFSIYEHRNTDSMYINGATNWDPETEPSGPRPREGGSKWDGFAEIEGTDKRRQAETLGYFLREAQAGRLENDTTLMLKAEKLDWNAILAKQIPAFGEWAKENGHWDPDAKREFE